MTVGSNEMASEEYGDESGEGSEYYDEEGLSNSQEEESEEGAEEN